MKTRPLYILLLLLVFLISSCSSDDDCTKTIIVQYEHVIQTPTGSTYLPEVTQEVPCSTPDPENQGEITESAKLENFSYEVLSFNYTPDTGNDTSRLQFEIKLMNNNDYTVSGAPILTMQVDDIKVSGSYSSEASSPCYELAANSSCILSFGKEESLELSQAQSVTLLDVEYLLTTD
ncbi:hypothetical protein SAMN05444483_101724 [Salegentibacter echinorum]|uniref:Lipoprotein n=1 Tax=Salegentibacter echinorum TaxID=1073325 RepID=A0A1M5CYF9_SALEC|nr:hypothetical protein [Salegentibacter echinorum]SHF59739.1 hypothetical protein SAMN05444483_101724 [Salegentibacter echinorum]